LFPYFLGQP